MSGNVRKSSAIAACLLGVVVVISYASVFAVAPTEELSAPEVEVFFDLLSFDPSRTAGALATIERQWHPRSQAMLLEIMRVSRSRELRRQIVALLQKQSGQQNGQDVGAWYRGIWRAPYQPHPRYAEFKASLYSRIDPRFGEYFASGAPATIRLDEIRWGGVRRDGIPPLKNPKTLAAAQAEYLADTDVVFGVVVNGEARAYPKRILAWHEMVKDVVGGVSINGVYCTLCGSMIVYQTETNEGTHYELGTSGFLYRSNKLMYDHATKSLWSTIQGEPVVGELVGKGIKLQPHYVVTTTWGQWRELHPFTRVLSLDTGYRRDYGEGVAYRSYFASDELMFDVPAVDTRLNNKDEVFVVRRPNSQPPLAISLKLLRATPVFHQSLGSFRFVVLTDQTGANRAYEAGDTTFVDLHNETVRDSSGKTWKVGEEALVADDGQVRRSRLPAHRAFWFGWYAANPETRLIK